MGVQTGEMNQGIHYHDHTHKPKNQQQLPYDKQHLVKQSLSSLKIKDKELRQMMSEISSNVGGSTKNLNKPRSMLGDYTIHALPPRPTQSNNVSKDNYNLMLTSVGTMPVYGGETKSRVSSKKMNGHRNMESDKIPNTSGKFHVTK
jgi:hypothetical protein